MSACCGCETRETTTLDGPTTVVDVDPACPCETCHKDPFALAVEWLRESRTTSNHHPKPQRSTT